MKHSKFLVIFPALALLATSCSPAAPTVDKGLPGGGREIQEEAKAGSLQDVFYGIVHSIEEEHQQYTLHLDGKLNHVPFEESEQRDESKITYRDASMNLDAVVTLSNPANGASALSLDVLDVDLYLQDMFEIKDLKLGLRYEMEGTKGAFLYADLSDPSVMEAVKTVAALAGASIDEKMIKSMLGENLKIKVSFDALVELLSGMLAQFFPEMDPVEASRATTAPTDWLKMGLAYVGQMIGQYIDPAQVKQVCASIQQALNAFLKVAEYGSAESHDLRVGAVLNATAEQVKALIPEAEEDPTQGKPNEESFMPNIDLDKLDGKFGLLVMVGEVSGQQNGKLTLEEINCSIEGSYDGSTGSANLSLKAAYGEKAPYTALTAEEAKAFIDITKLIPTIMQLLG